LWSEKRVQKVVDAAVKHGVAVEISSSLRLPKLFWLEMAKEAGTTFSFGSNIRGPEVGKMDYCIEMAKKLGLTRERMFTPAPAGKKAIQRRG
jgi:histidinol phosphatase-like PHP family hydrolase